MSANENEVTAYLADLHEEKLSEMFLISKEDDGRYHIVAVSTAALEDREGETFTTEAMDRDIQFAKETNEYPEFRVFHQKGLGVGKVTNMRRIGIFAVDEGYSYTDPFSLAVCEKMLSANPGKWKTSRGFFIFKAAGGCPSCGSQLSVGIKHMKSGFRCPVCMSAYKDYKGVLNNVRFLETKTFDITITDKPAVPWTGVAAFRDNSNSEEFMDKKELKKRLMGAGLPEDAVDERLNSLTDAQLKEYSDAPFAEVLKEFGVSEDGEALDLDEVVKEFTKVVESTVEAKMKEVLANFELQVTDLGDLEVDMKEVPEITAMKEEIVGLKEQLDQVVSLLEKLTQKDEQRIKEMVDEMPRAGKLRIRRFGMKETMPDEEDDEDEDDSSMPKKKSGKACKESDGMVYGADGETARSMAEWLQQNN